MRKICELAIFRWQWAIQWWSAGTYICHSLKKRAKMQNFKRHPTSDWQKYRFSQVCFHTWETKAVKWGLGFHLRLLYLYIRWNKMQGIEPRIGQLRSIIFHIIRRLIFLRRGGGGQTEDQGLAGADEVRLILEIKLICVPSTCLLARNRDQVPLWHSSWPNCLGRSAPPPKPACGIGEQN